MAFGTKYTYNPVPSKLGMLLVAKANAGKSTFASQMVPQGKLGVVVDADGSFDEVVTNGVNFVPMSDEPYDMLEPKKIHDAVHNNMPNKEVGLFLVDSVTAILEPIILDIQRNVEEGTEKGARGFKAKADAMKYLQAGLCPWGIDVIWVYHYRDHGDAFGNMETVTTITDLELSRLYRNINIKCEILVDATGKRGLHVLSARGGRSDITLWDESGTWEGIRAKLEQEVWGGLSKEQQEELTETIVWASPDEAIGWAWELSQQGSNIFRDAKHVENSYQVLRGEMQEAYGNDLTAEIMFRGWKTKVEEKVLASQEAQ